MIVPSIPWLSIDLGQLWRASLRFAGITVGQHARRYWPYLVARPAGLILIICLPELSLFLPRSAGLTR